MINITYAVTVCNELVELTNLVNFLHPRIQKDDEILIQYDSENVSKPVLDYLNIISQLHKSQIRVIPFPLNKDFASFKNNLKNNANGIFIFQIDADEIPSEYLVANMRDFLESNKDVDLFFVPRINTVNGWVNFPDYQTRIYRRTSEIHWVNKVHERIVGFNTMSVLPSDEEYCLYHHKQIERQEKQNSFYDTI
jgi:hypothetical protein